MYLKFIGTGSGKTSLSRFHSSFLISTDNKNILVDAGDGISKALLTQGISYNSIDSLILTHYHSDHLAGLPSLLTQMIIDKRTKPFKIYTHKKLVKALKNFLYSSFLFLETFDFNVKIIEFDFRNDIIVDDNFRFTAKQNSHITNRHSINNHDLAFISSSFLFKIKNKKIIYTSDIGDKKDLSLFESKNIDYFITETTHIELFELERYILKQNFKSVILTHISDNEKENLQIFINKLKSSNNINAILAEDRMILPL